MIVDLTDFRTGFCDCLKQVTFCIAIAQLRADKTIYVKQNITKHCPYRIIDLLEVSGFDVHPWDTSCGNTDLRFNHFISVRNRPADIKLSDKEFANRWCAAYRLLHPKDHIQRKIDLLDINHSYLGFHVRMTDRIKKHPLPWEIMKFQVNGVVSSSHNLIKSKINKYGLKKIFLTCDNLESKIEWSQKLSEHNVEVVSNPDIVFDISRFRQTSGEHFVVDLFSLSRCHTIVGTTKSAVPLSAKLIGDITDVCFGVDRTPSVIVTRNLFRYRSLYWKYLSKKRTFMRKRK